MTPDSLDAEPVVSTFARKRCSECEGWALELEDGICRPCLGQPVKRMASQETPKWQVYDAAGNQYYDFHRQEAAEKAAQYFDTTARRIR